MQSLDVFQILLSIFLDVLTDSVRHTLDSINILQIYFLDMSFKTPFKHNLTTVSTIYKVYYKVLYKYLYKRILQEYLQDTTTNNPTKFSTTYATTYTTTGLQHTLCQLLHQFYKLLLILDYYRRLHLMMYILS